MSEDSEVGASPVGDKKNTSGPDDIHSYVSDVLLSFPWFTLVISFILYLLLQSTTYNKHVLQHTGKDSLNEMGHATERGILITGMILAILVASLSGLHNSNYL
jgi:hypothetical protein